MTPNMYIPLFASYSCSYYKFQVEISAAANQDFYIKIVHEVLNLWFTILTVYAVTIQGWQLPN